MNDSSKEMITIRDVAKLAGVSVTSASYALNDTGTISDETRKRVLKAAEDLNYHPNAFARHLKTRKTHTIGVFIISFSGSFYDEILEGIHVTALKTDYELLVCPISRSIRRILTQRQVDGAIIFDPTIKTETLVKLASERFPIVVMDRELKMDYILPMLIDNMGGTKEAFYHLYDQGARKIFFVAGSMESFDNHERMRAFLIEADKNNLPVKCFNGNFTEQSGYDVGKAIIESDDLPEAVFCANDQMAIGFMRAMEERNLKVPDDIAIVGFDNIQVGRFMKPSLSTVGASRPLWGSLAAGQLINFMENGASFPAPRLEARLIVRESSRMSVRSSPSSLLAEP